MRTRRKRWMGIFGVSALAGLAFLSWRVGLVGLVRSRGDVETGEEWERLGESPDASDNCSPQGMAFVDGALYVSNHWNGRKSKLYRVDAESGAVTASASMPPEAKHTSGLTGVDGEVWAVDHASNVLYELDTRATFDSGEATVERRYDTGLSGASGLTAMRVDGADHIAVSDFVWTIETTPPLPLGTGRTFVAPLVAVRAGLTVRETASISYENGGYSQGLTWDGEYLYESANNLGIDRVEMLDVRRAVERGEAGEIRRCGSFEGPAGRIEDLGTDGDRLWTTDEGTDALYRLDDLDRVKGGVMDR